MQKVFSKRVVKELKRRGSGKRAERAENRVTMPYNQYTAIGTAVQEIYNRQFFSRVLHMSYLHLFPIRDVEGLRGPTPGGDRLEPDLEESLRPGMMTLTRPRNPGSNPHDRWPPEPSLSFSRSFIAEVQGTCNACGSRPIAAPSGRLRKAGPCSTSTWRIGARRWECSATSRRSRGRAHGGTVRYREAAAAVRNWDGLGARVAPHPGGASNAPPFCRPPPPVRPETLLRAEGAKGVSETPLSAPEPRPFRRGGFPTTSPSRLSNRMKTRIGQMVPGSRNGIRRVVEIALNVDLMLEGNGRERIDTLVHEMAHAAAWLFSGGLDHGPSWRRWARHAGCGETASAVRPIRRRARGVRQVTRVPRLPAAARAADGPATPPSTV